MSNDIQLSYYCRDSIKGILNMAIKNGMWNVITMKLCPGAMGIRHFIPLAFVLSILFGCILGMICPIFLMLLGIEALLYLAFDMLFSINAAKSFKEFLILMFLFPAFHSSYGLGSMMGIAKLFTKEFGNNGYENIKI